MRIGLFDSGLGGLTVLKEFKKKYPKNEYIYLGDNKNLPYGSKTKEELYNLSKANIEFLLSKNVDMIIIACGTVSTNVYDEIKGNYNVPIYDIVNPTINYINNNHFRSVGLIATQGTINSGKFNNVDHKQACPLLVPYIEGDTSINVNMVLKEYLKDMIHDDAIILGCTHYPLLENEIKQLTDAKLINMGTVLADSINVVDSIDSTELYFTNLNNEVINRVNHILGSRYDIKEATCQNFQK